MTTVKFSFGPHFGYRNEFVELDESTSEVSVTLENGTHAFTSGDVPIGRIPAFENRRLMARITFQYGYDQTGQSVTVNGTDYASADSMCLVTFPEGTTEYCRQRAAAAAGFPADDLTGNRHWNYRTSLMPGVEDVLRGMARAASDALIAALKQVPGLIVRVRDDVPELPAEDYRQLLTVYRNGVFRGFYGQVGDLTADDTVQPIESTYYGTADFGQGADFANVRGSTDDPKPTGYSSWVSLWKAKANNDNAPTACTSFGFKSFQCGGQIVGGHVIRGRTVSSLPKGSDVYILPICDNHNKNNSVYMSTINYKTAVWLKNYLK
jgi:hypothetical protein